MEKIVFFNGKNYTRPFKSRPYNINISPQTLASVDTETKFREYMHHNIPLEFANTNYGFQPPNTNPTVYKTDPVKGVCWQNNATAFKGDEALIYTKAIERPKSIKLSFLYSNAVSECMNTAFVIRYFNEEGRKLNYFFLEIHDINDGYERAILKTEEDTTFRPGTPYERTIEILGDEIPGVGEIEIEFKVAKNFQEYTFPQGLVTYQGGEFWIKTLDIIWR